MRFNRIIISFILLLAYSTGFAHNLIPHCSGNVEHHISSNTEDSHHHHSHHQHDEDSFDEVEHNHITHKDHYDSNYFDFIVCLFNDVNHAGSDCSQEHCFLVSSESISVEDLIKTNLNILLTTIQVVDSSEEPTKCFEPEVSSKYLSPPRENTPHRGPPLFSC